MTASVTLGTQAIGAAGELLVQYELLKQGIDSARLTTDSGTDLVLYVSGHQSAATVQVKTKLKPVPAGGKGKLLLSWPFPDDSKAQWLACVADRSPRGHPLFTFLGPPDFKFSRLGCIDHAAPSSAK